MFHGSVPSSMQSIINEAVGGWGCSDIFVGCSGNFTIERVLGKHSRWGLHSNDVTIYSSMVGQYLSSGEVRLSIKDEWREMFGWLDEYMKTGTDKLATVLLCTRLLDGLGRENPYYERMRTAYKDQWEDLHQKTAKKIEGVSVRLKEFHCGDVVDWFGSVPKNQGVVCFPLFFAGDYKSMFANLDTVFDWDEPEYEEMTEGRKDLLLKVMQDKDYWLLGVPRELDELKPFLRGMTKTTNRGTPIYVYTKGGNTRIVQPRQKTAPLLVKRLSTGETIGDVVTLKVLRQDQFQALRSLYMNRHINPGSATMSVGVCVDGVLVGVYALSAAPSFGNYNGALELPYLYLLSDFPVAPTSYPRLAKLVLYAALSSEGKLLAERCANKRIRSLVTTAFSKRPVSMKYRGLFELISRKEKKDQAADENVTSETYYQQGYQLNYGARMGEWTLAEGLSMWKKKHGKRVE